MMDIFLITIPSFGDPETWMSLLTLTFLEIVLGIDNIIFISLVAGKLPKDEQAKATNIGLILAMVLRIVLLFGISALIAMESALFEINFLTIHGAVSGQSLILFAGGVFLLYKATSEIHHKLEGEDAHGEKKKISSLTKAIIQITLINIVFSFDSILTAVGMTTGLAGALFIMIVAVVISVIIMMAFALPIGRFVNKHPTFQMLGLSFLLLIGFMLIAEAAHLAHLVVGGQEIGTVPKGYLYFAISFSLLVEFFNMKLRQTKKPVQLRGIQEEANLEGRYNEPPLRA